jgi:hypothetical protein
MVDTVVVVAEKITNTGNALDHGVIFSTEFFIRVAKLRVLAIGQGMEQNNFMVGIETAGNDKGASFECP